jgi:DNA-binding HxlR family transcriptional regulator
MLSEQQKRVLRWLLAAVRDLESVRNAAARSLLREGIDWRPRAGNKERESCWRSSLCRTLARLEQRGLITRIRGPKNARTVRLKFTNQGRKTAEMLSG